MVDHIETDEEKLRRESDEVICVEVSSGVDLQGERVKSCLIALRMANIPFDSATVSALHELSQRIAHIINEAMGDD